MNIERKQSKENLSSGDGDPRPAQNADELLVDRVISQRKESLTELGTKISRKLYYRLEEKIKQEEEEFKALLNIHQTRKEQMDKYSLVLDSQYFEQIFFN